MTLSEKAYAALRRDIIHGTLNPGDPLRMAVLSERYEMGFSPLREALNRLQAERLVVAEALRGFRVAPLSVEEMEDAVSTRIVVECDALRLSIRQGDDDWQAAIVAALYALKLQAARAAESRAAIWEIEARHYAFHRSLLAACGSAWRMEIFDRLYAATERYRVPILAASGGRGQPARDIQAEHGALADATLARDADHASELLARHYRLTADMIRDRMLAAA